MRPAVRVRADPARLAGYGLSMEDVRNAVVAANVNGAKGGFDGPRQAIALGANDQIMVARGLRPHRHRLSQQAAGAVVATSARSYQVWRTTGSSATYNGKPAVVLDIQRQPGANIVATVERLKQALPDTGESAMPSAASSSPSSPTAPKPSAPACRRAGHAGAGDRAGVGVIWLFLRFWRATLIPAVALPLSLIGTLRGDVAARLGLDNLSLMALTIATGFVVDDAIVMIENVVRYIEQGETPHAGRLQGRRTDRLHHRLADGVADRGVHPAAVHGGVVGRLFREFAVTLSVAVVVSAVVSLTLTPMMCAPQLLRPARSEMHPGWISRGAERGL
jgi:multidrug efflux pump subunit AcrB